MIEYQLGWHCGFRYDWKFFAYDWEYDEHYGYFDNWLRLPFVVIHWWSTPSEKWVKGYKQWDQSNGQ